MESRFRMAATMPRTTPSAVGRSASASSQAGSATAAILLPGPRATGSAAGATPPVRGRRVRALCGTPRSPGVLRDRERGGLGKRGDFGGGRSIKKKKKRAKIFPSVVVTGCGPLLDTVTIINLKPPAPGGLHTLPEFGP